MNWMKIALNALRWKVLAFGAIAGLWGGFLHEAALLLPAHAGWQGLRIVVASAALGLGLGLVVAPTDALLHHYLRRAARTGIAGALLGAVLGALGAAAMLGLMRGAAVSAWFTPAEMAWVGLAVTLGLVGGGCGLAVSLGATHGRALHQIAIGLGVGAALGVLVAGAVRLSGSNPWISLAALLLWSGALALALHWWDRRRARRWLRLLTGPGEDDIFPLMGEQITLGTNERNDIALRDFQEIYPYHCELRWAADHYEIIDNEQGGVVLVNYRQVQEHVLKPGDLVKIGSALLQYGEAQ